MVWVSGKVLLPEFSPNVTNITLLPVLISGSFLPAKGFSFHRYRAAQKWRDLGPVPPVAIKLPGRSISEAYCRFGRLLFLAGSCCRFCIKFRFLVRVSGFVLSFFFLKQVYLAGKSVFCFPFGAFWELPLTRLIFLKLSSGSWLGILIWVVVVRLAVLAIPQLRLLSVAVFFRNGLEKRKSGVIWHRICLGTW